MNPSIAHRFHVGAIGALIVISLVNLNFQYGVEYPEGYTGYRWFGMIYSVVVVALLGVRLRQLITQAVFVSPQTDIERFAVNAGYSLIGLALVLLLTGIIMYFVGGGLSSTLFPQVAIAGFWIGLACIELVIANGRSAVIPPAERPSGTARFFVGMILLLAGFGLGVSAVFGFFFAALGH